MAETRGYNAAAVRVTYCRDCPIRWQARNYRFTQDDASSERLTSTAGAFGTNECRYVTQIIVDQVNQAERERLTSGAPDRGYTLELTAGPWQAYGSDRAVAIPRRVLDNITCGGRCPVTGNRVVGGTVTPIDVQPDPQRARKSN